MKKDLSNDFLNTMSRETGNWKGLFYFNSKDPRLMVPKSVSSLGWTLNFASPYAWLIVALICIIIVGSVIIA